MRFSGLRRLACGALRGFLPSACGSRVNLENYNKLKVGQSYEEALPTVGEPVRCDEALAVRLCTWGDAQRGMSVNFVARTVLLLSARNLQ